MTDEMSEKSEKVYFNFFNHVTYPHLLHYLLIQVIMIRRIHVDNEVRTEMLYFNIYSKCNFKQHDDIVLHSTVLEPYVMINDLVTDVPNEIPHQCLEILNLLYSIKIIKSE